MPNGPDEPNANPDRPGSAATIANIVLLAVSLLAVAGGLLVYVDRDGEGRTEDGIVAADVIQVSVNVAGPIADLAVRDNQLVKAGDLLLRIDPRPYEARVQEAKGRHEAAIANRRDKQLRYERAKSEFRAGAVVSQQLVDDAEAAAQAASADVDSTAGELALAQVELDYCTVTAPFDGIVTGLTTQVGEYATPGSTIFALIDAKSFHVVAFMKEQYLGPAAPGAKARVKLWQYPDEEFTGQVESVGRGVHSRTLAGGLPVVEKTLDWVQLAARIPVRIRLDTHRPLTMGTTAHVATLMLMLCYRLEVPRSWVDALSRRIARTAKQGAG